MAKNYKAPLSETIHLLLIIMVGCPIISATVFGQSQHNLKERKPNIIFLLTDDIHIIYIYFKFVTKRAE